MMKALYHAHFSALLFGFREENERGLISTWPFEATSISAFKCGAGSPIVEGFFWLADGVPFLCQSFFAQKAIFLQKYFGYISSLSVPIEGSAALRFAGAFEAPRYARLLRAPVSSEQGRQSKD